MFLDAVRVRKAGDAARSKMMFEALLREHPACHEAHYMLGMLNAELGDLESAERGLREALSHEADHPEYLFRLGSIVLTRGRAEEAADLLRRAEAEADESAPLLIALGSACFQSVSLPEAEQAFRRALALDPSNAEAGAGLLAVMMGGRRLEEASAFGEELVRTHPRRGDLRARLAQALERSNRLADARQHADAALAINPNDSIALGVKATLLQRAGEKQASIEVFEHAIRSSASKQERRDLSRALGLVLDELKRHDEAYARFIESKKPITEIPAASTMLARDVERYIGSCIRGIGPGTTGVWRDPPADGLDTPVFFVGFPRSGTTLLEQMLGAHPRLVTTDEIQSLGKCTEWIGQHAGGLEFAPGAYGGLDAAALAMLRRKYWSEIEAELGSAAIAGKRLIDKHPMNTSNLYTARRLFPGAKVIVSLRDPRDVILSCFMHLSRTPMAVVYFKDLPSAARLYAQIMGLWFHMRQTLGLPWMEVKYEDVVEDTEGTARRVLEFLGEPWDDSVMRFSERAEKKAIRSTSYQQVSQGVYTRAMGRWRAYEKHFGEALEILEPFARALGYGDR